MKKRCDKKNRPEGEGCGENGGCESDQPKSKLDRFNDFVGGSLQFFLVGWFIAGKGVTTVAGGTEKSYIDVY